MAKRTRASARGKRKTTHRSRKISQTLQPPTQPAPKPAAIRRRGGTIAIKYTAELLENARHRFEETDEPATSIAADLGVHRNTLRRVSAREGWKRYVPTRDLSPAARLLVQAKRLEAAGPSQSEERADPADDRPERRTNASAPSLGGDLQPPRQDGDAVATVAEEAPLPDLPTTIKRLHRAVLEELAAVETMRAALTREPQSPADAERTVRTLSNLTEILQKLQRLQCALPGTQSHDDDLPVDIDEFREELARRIEAFVASRADEGDDD
jgi:hypothetical protein